MSQQQTLTQLTERFRQVQVELRTLERELGQVSPAVRQSAALLAMSRWVAKADKVVQQLLELRA